MSQILVYWQSPLPAILNLRKYSSSMWLGCFGIKHYNRQIHCFHVKQWQVTRRKKNLNKKPINCAKTKRLGQQPHKRLAMESGLANKGLPELGKGQAGKRKLKNDKIKTQELLLQDSGIGIIWEWVPPNLFMQPRSSYLPSTSLQRRDRLADKNSLQGIWSSTWRFIWRCEGVDFGFCCCFLFSWVSLLVFEDMSWVYHLFWIAGTQEILPTQHMKFCSNLPALNVCESVNSAKICTSKVGVICALGSKA